MDQKLSIALDEILRPTQQSYFDAHAGWWDTGLPPQDWQPIVYTYPKLTIIGSAHSNQPNSPMINQIKSLVTDFLDNASISQSQKLVMIEGYTTGTIPIYDSLDQAISLMGESGMGAFLAIQSGVKLTSAEAKGDAEANTALVKKLLADFTPEQAILYDLLDSLPSLIRKNELYVERVAGLIFHFARQYGSNWQYQTVEAVLESINQMIQEYLGYPIWEIKGPDIRLLVSHHLLTELTNNIVFKDTDHPYANYLNDIGRILDAARDDHLLSSIYKTHQIGLHVLVVFGGSHILAIKPALDYLFENE